MRHINGDSRQQGLLLPSSLDDYVDDNNPVRVVDAFIDSLDLVNLGFSKAITKTTGRRPYNPADLLKLYVYGYLNQVRSSRRLEKECSRNLEVIWLMKRLAPDFKTLADFRKDNTEAIKGACQAFIQFCRQADLLTGRLVAIDGSKFKAAASKDKATTRKHLLIHRQRQEELIKKYLDQLAAEDGEGTYIDMDSQKVERALNTLKGNIQKLTAIEAAMDDKGSNQYCTTEPDAKLMRSGRDGMVLGYNVQTAVDVDNGLIVHHEVIDEGSDNRQLQPMAEGAKAVLEAQLLSVVADAGYSNGEQQSRCEEQGISVVVPSNRAINNQSDGCFQKSDFKYDKSADCFTCPAGQELAYKTHNTKNKMHLYSRSGCNQCTLQSKCTKADRRWVSRHFYEEAFERSERRLAANPELMTIRMAAVERPFAVLKQIMGIRRFQCWSISGAQSEMGISVLSYNLARMMSEIGVPKLLAALR